MMKALKVSLLAYTAALVLVLSGQAKAQYDPKALATLDEMSKKYSAMSGFKATFTYSMSNPSAGINESSSGTITVKASKFHLVMGNQEVYNNGTTVWTFLKDANEVNISNYDPQDDDITPTKIYSIYKKGYKYMLVEEKTEAGVVVQVIDLIPENRNNPFFKVRLTINKKDKTIKAWKIFEKSGNSYDYAVKTFTPNLVLNDTEFVFDKNKYKGVEVIDLR
jgi:outer membrane lipoprotein carrier protein